MYFIRPSLRIPAVASALYWCVVCVQTLWYEVSLTTRPLMRPDIKLERIRACNTFHIW
jgi:hypothetical protein